MGRKPARRRHGGPLHASADRDTALRGSRGRNDWRPPLDAQRTLSLARANFFHHLAAGTSYALRQCSCNASRTPHLVRRAQLRLVAVSQVLEPMSIGRGMSGAPRVKAPDAYQRSYAPWQIRFGPYNTRWMPYSKKA